MGIRDYEKQIDQLACLPRQARRRQVYKLYGLTPREKEIVEKTEK